MYIESEKLELKSTLNEWREIIISLSAFANKSGGKVIVGLDEKGEPVGLEIGKNTLEDLANKIKTHTDPVLYPSINTLTFGPGEIIEIEVPASDNKPVFAFDRAYLRVGRTNQKINNSQLRELIKRYTLPDFDRRPFEGGTIKTIDWDEKLMAEAAENYGFKFKTPGEFLKKIKAVCGARPTNAAYLCFAKNTGSMFNALIRAARFQGDSTVKFLDMKDFDNNLISAVNEVIKFVKLNTRNEIVISGQARHKEIWDYPLEALREAIINALAHRDYNDPGQVQIRIFDNRLAIWSPGLLPKEINIKNLGQERRSIPRNKLLVEIFHKLKIMEVWGSGFRKIIDLTIKNGNPAPEFSEITGAFVITFRKREKIGGVNGGVNGGVKLVVDFVSQYPGSRTGAIAKALNRSDRTVEKWLEKLKKTDKIEYRGSSKSGGYYLK
jgi:ATP-dependent DNA helicase RecG